MYPLCFFQHGMPCFAKVPHQHWLSTFGWNKVEKVSYLNIILYNFQFMGSSQQKRQKGFSSTGEIKHSSSSDSRSTSSTGNRNNNSDCSKKKGESDMPRRLEHTEIYEHIHFIFQLAIVSYLVGGITPKKKNTYKNIWMPCLFTYKYYYASYVCL